MNDCIVCEALRPDSDPSYADINTICSFDYGLLTSWLRAIPDQYSALLGGEVLPVDGRREWRFVGAHLGVANLVEVWADPVAAVVPSGPVRGATGAPRISGGGERPLGVPAGHLDLIVPVSDVPYLRRGAARLPDDTAVLDVRVARHVIHVEVEGDASGRQVEVWERHLEVDRSGRPQYRWAGDRVGTQPTAIWLDRTVQHWLSRGAPGKHLPDPSVPALVGWLRDRLDWATGSLPNLGEFATGLRRERSALRRATGDIDDRTTLCAGVVCAAPRCQAATLLRKPDYVECDSCGRLYSDVEFDVLRDEQMRARPKRKKAA